MRRRLILLHGKVCLTGLGIRLAEVIVIAGNLVGLATLLLRIGAADLNRFLQRRG